MTSPPRQVAATAGAVARGPPAARGAAMGSAKRSPAGPEAGRRWLRQLEVAALLSASIYATVFWLRLPAALPASADYLALQAVVDREGRPGDGAAVLPFWAERAKIFLPRLPVLALPALEREQDCERFSRLWVVAQPQLPRSDARSSLEALSHKLVAQGPPRHFGPLELWLFAPREGRVATYDLLVHLGDAQVIAQSGPPPRVLWREFDFLPRHCLMVQGQLSLHFPAVSLAHGLRLGAGAAVGTRGGGQVSLTVDGQSLPSLAMGVATGGAAWSSSELVPAALGPGDSFGAHQVDLSIDGPGLCVDAVAF